jgi:hypothetical protein
LTFCPPKMYMLVLLFNMFLLKLISKKRPFWPLLLLSGLSLALFPCMALFTAYLLSARVCLPIPLPS